MDNVVAGVAVTRERVIDDIASALTQVLDHELPELNERTELFDQLGLDSTGVLEMLMLLEESLGVEFDSEGFEMSNFHSIGALADFVTAGLAG